MKKHLYLMRHGQTRFNLLGKVQGACDSPLTEDGIEQAKRAKAYFDKKNLRFKEAYSSTQERACDTLELIIGESQPYQRKKGLKEWDFGLFEAERESLQPKHKPGETSYGDAFVDFGGESHLTVAKRMNETLMDIMENTPEENVLAVSHGGAIYLFLQEWMPFEEVKKIRFSNCAIMHLVFENGEFTFIDWVDPLETK